MIYAQVFENGGIQIFESTVSDSLKYETIKFGFPPKWNNYTKTAVFRNGENTIGVILNADGGLCTGKDECYIPHEVIKSPQFTVSVFGVLGESRVTTSKAVIRVVESGYGEGDEPSDPTPTEYQQLVNIANETKQIAQSVRNDADNGIFNGENGKDGYTPILGVDYVTIDQSTEYVFDGGNAEQNVPTVIMVDDALSQYSSNAIMNKTVAEKFSKLDNDFSEINNDFSEINSDLSETNSTVNSLNNRIYIVESSVLAQGNGSGWNYRKWSDGTAECWGRFGVSAVAESQWTTYYTANLGVFSYPADLFIEEPILNCILKCADFPGHLFFGTNGSQSSTGIIGAACHDARTINGYLHLTAKGVWK